MDLTSKNPDTEQDVFFYRECLKNHAATRGGHALDGCGEFTPSLSATSSVPTSLTCAACGCHRNFHRREPDDPNSNLNFLTLHQFHHYYRFLPPGQLGPSQRSPSPISSTPSPTKSPSSPTPLPVSQLPPPPPPSYCASQPQMMLALTAGPSGPSDENHHRGDFNLTVVKTENRKKRMRTKFSQEQKEKMCSFAEKIGWKLQKCDKRSVEEFCDEIGIGKRVLKVWMHNNKHVLRKGVDDDNNNNKGCNDRINGAMNDRINGDDGFDRASACNNVNESNECNRNEGNRADFRDFSNGSSSSS